MRELQYQISNGSWEDCGERTRVIKARKEIKNEIFKIRKYIEKKLSAN